MLIAIRHLGGGLQRALARDGGFQPIQGGGEGSLEGIADGFEDDAVVGFDGLTEGGVVDLEGIRHLLRLRFPQWRATHDVREQEGDRTRGQ